MPNSELAKLNDVLARERAALLTADYAALAPLAAVKEQLLNGLVSNVPAKIDLVRLKAAMQSNLDLTSAALRGVAAAKDRIVALESVRDGLTTYDRSGTVAQVSQTQNKIEKKA